RLPATLTLAAGLLVLPAAAAARSAGDPIRLVWDEGDVAGTSTIYGPDGGEPIGFIEYRQTRHGDRLSSARIAHFRDGSSDEDSADARVDGTLEALAGRTIISDADGVPALDLTLDVPGGEPARARLATRRFELGPTIHWTVDPLRRLVLPRATFWMLPGEPPALARFTGPRNYAREAIVIQ